LKLISARNEAHRQPGLNLHLARAYLTASAPAFVDAPAADEDADLSLCRFTKRPVNRHAVANVRGQFPRDFFQRRRAENFHGAVVGFQRIVKRHFIILEASV